MDRPLRRLCRPFAAGPPLLTVLDWSGPRGKSSQQPGRRPGRACSLCQLDGNCGPGVQRCRRVATCRLVLSVVHTRPFHLLRVRTTIRLHTLIVKRLSKGCVWLFVGNPSQSYRSHLSHGIRNLRTLAG